MLFKTPARQRIDPIGLHRPFAARAFCDTSNPAGVAIIIFDIIGPCHAVAQLGQGFG